MEFRYDFNLNNCMLSIHDSSTDTVYVTRSPKLMNVFSQLIDMTSDATLDSSIHTFMTAYKLELIRVR